MRRKFLLRVLLPLLGLTAPRANCQVVSITDQTTTPRPGAGHDYIQMLNETVNPANGSLSVRIAVPTPPGRGLSLPLSIAYDSNGASFIQQSVVFSGHPLLVYSNVGPFAQGGWSYTLPQLTDRVIQFTPSSPTGDGYPICTGTAGYTFTDSAGARDDLRLSNIGGMYKPDHSTTLACAESLWSQFTTGGNGVVQALLLNPGQSDALADQPITPSTEPYIVPAEKDDGSPLIVDADGTVYTFPVTPGNGWGCAHWHDNNDQYFTSGFPSSIEDRNGNVINITSTQSGVNWCYPGSTYTVTATDTLGRTLFSASNFGVSGSTISVAGQANPFTITWAGGGISAVSLPNSRSYSFYPGQAVTINSQAVVGSSSTCTPIPTQLAGGITKIVYPSGGYISYVWGVNPLSAFISYNNLSGAANQCQYYYDTPAIIHRYVSYDGITIALQQDFSYSTNWSNGNIWSTKTTTVTTRDLIRGTSLQTVYTYAAFAQQSSPNTPSWPTQYLPVESTIAYYDTDGSLKRTVTKNMGTAANSLYTPILNCEMETLDNGLVAGAFYGYAPGQQPSDKKEYDYGQLSSASACSSNVPPQTPTPTRETVTTYQSFTSTPIFTSAPSIFDRPCQVITYGSGTRVAETDFFYDGSTGTTPCSAATRQSLSGTGNYTGHDEALYGTTVTPPRGNATTVTRQCFLGSTACTNSVSTYTFDETGQVLSMTEPCGNATCTDMNGTSHATTYSYVDSYTVLSGGQNVSFSPPCIPPNPSNCTTNSYLTKTIDPLGHTKNFTYDFNNGQLTVSKDQNGQITTHLYNDSLARPTQTNYPDGGKTTIAYNDAPYNSSTPSPSIATTKAITSSTNLTTVTAFDGMGHAVRSVLASDPDCSSGDRTDTTYDGIGHVYTVSNPYCTTSDPTYGLTTHVYDGLGRTTHVIPPDGSASANNVTTTYSGNCTTVSDQAGNPRKTCSDALGRLIEVDEPGTGAQSATPGSGQVTVSGAEQSHTFPATHSTGRITINSNTSTQVSVTVGSYKCPNFFFPIGTPPNSIANAFASCLNGHLVNAGSSSNVVSLTSIATGSATNYSISMSGINGSSSGMSGGADSYTIYDNGTLTVTVNGFPGSVSYGSTSTPAGLASALASALSVSGSPVTATSNGATITLAAIGVGAATNYSVSTSASWNTSNFGSASFTFQTPVISILTGGANATLGNAPLVTLYTYDALNDLTCAVQKGTDTTAFTNCASAPTTWRPRSSTYDSLSRLTSSTDPESNTISSTGASLPTTYSYDANGNLSSKTSPAPNQIGATTVTTNYLHDALNRLTQKSYSDGATPTVKYGYDAVALSGCTVAPPTLSDAYPIGRRTAMCDGAGAESWSHDTMGRTLTGSRTTNGITKSTVYAYSPYVDGSINTVTYPSTRVVTYNTGAAERLLSVQDNSNSVYYAAAAHYAPTGTVSSLVNNTNLISTLFYNSRLQPCRISVKSSGTAPSNCADLTNKGNVLDFTYGFNLGSADNGNVASIANNNDNTRSQNFTYDTLNRIATAQTQTTGVTIPNPNCWGLSFTEDPWANLLSWTSNAPAGCSGTLPLNVTVTTANRINTNTVASTTTNYCYDSAGNLIHTVAVPATCPTSGPFQDAYNAENQLISAGGVTYGYDGDGRRVMKSNGKLYWYGMSSDVLDETDLQGNTNNSSFNEFVFFSGMRIARRDYQNNVFYYFADHLGTARNIQEVPNGQTTPTPCYDADFYPYGGERIVTDSCDSNYKFTAKERDSESGLDYFVARYNSTQLGRFMSPDSDGTGAKGTTPQSWNAYSYVANNPLLYTDPDGTRYLICVLGESQSVQCTDISDADFSNLQKDPGAGASLRNGLVYARGGVIGFYLQTDVDLPQDVSHALHQAGVWGTTGVNYAMLATAPNFAVIGGAHVTLAGGLTVLGGQVCGIACPILPVLGSKLDYLFGLAENIGENAAHNVQRSVSMLQEMESVGLSDTPQTRVYVSQKIIEAFYNPAATSAIGRGGAVIKDVLIMGPNGGIKLQTIWQGAQLVTIKVFH
jgi:RHS repeat-associated protein